MDGYLSKPIQPAELRRAIAALTSSKVVQISRVRSVFGPEKESIQTRVIPAENRTHPTQGEEAREQHFDSIDRTVALETVGGDADLLEGLIDTFLQECPNLLANLHDAVALRDGGALVRAAHTIKGAVNLFGAHAAGQEAQRLETMGRENQFHQAAEVCAAVERGIERVKQDLAALRGKRK